LDIETKLRSLAKHQLYDEADRLYSKLKNLKRKDTSDTGMRNEQKIQNLLAKQSTLFLKEFGHASQRFELGMSELLSSKAVEEEKLMNKIDFLSRNLENLQIQEYNSFEKDLKTFNKHPKIVKSQTYTTLLKNKSPRSLRLE